MEFRQLKTFRVVAARLNFTRAAEELNLAQSSVSAQINALEEDLGVSLFDRLGRSVVLTEAGRQLYDYAGRLEGMTEEIRSVLSGDGHSRGHLTIRIPETLASVYMPSLIARFHSEFPSVGLRCMNCTDRDLPRELNTGKIDLAFLMSDSVMLKDVQVRRLWTEPLVLVARPDHHLTETVEGRTLADLTGETLLLPETD